MTLVMSNWAAITLLLLPLILLALALLIGCIGGTEQ